jgi:hypothetical protein
MKQVDTKMAECPLKHEIRVNFWEPFIKKLGRSSLSYLTLYSPPLMDVKYFSMQGYIERTGGKYARVVGVTNDEKAYADASTELDNRLELTLPGDINELLGAEKGKVAVIKQLRESFPFDVINLDYTDVLHRLGLKYEISAHIQTIDQILRLQQTNNKEEFVFFLTTRATLKDYKTEFLDDLRQGLDENIAGTPNFSNTFEQECGCKSATEWCKKDERSYFALALAKFLFRLIRQFSYDLIDWDIRWLIRDDSPPTRHLLHIALHIKKFIPKKTLDRKSIFRRTNEIEKKSVGFIRQSYPNIAEKRDRYALAAKHSDQLRELNANRFELKTPKPRNNA